MCQRVQKHMDLKSGGQVFEQGDLHAARVAVESLF